MGWVSGVLKRSLRFTFFFLPAFQIDLSPKRLIRRHYAFFGYIVSYQILWHPFRLVIKDFDWYAENRAELLDNLIVRWFATSSLDVVKVRKRDWNAVVLFELCRQFFQGKLERFASGSNVLSETDHLLRHILCSQISR